jgi:hypothetical protein
MANSHARLKAEGSTFHISVNIADELVRIKDTGKTIFDCSLHAAMMALTRAQATGKKYYSGCDAMNAEGQCAGHGKKKKTV